MRAAGMRPAGRRGFTVALEGGVSVEGQGEFGPSALPEVDEMYVFPSGGDESNSIGAAC